MACTTQELKYAGGYAMYTHNKTNVHITITDAHFCQLLAPLYPVLNTVDT